MKASWGMLTLPMHLHLLFPFLLLLEQLALAGDVAAVALGGDVLAHRGDGFAGDDLAADGGLDGDDEELVRDDFLELAGEQRGRRTPALSRWTMLEKASTGSPLMSMSIFTMFAAR